jgi:predicted nucleotidyltransferase component of viral defense system
VLDSLRATLDPWLGVPKRKRGHGRVTALYRFESTSRPVQSMRLKVEINSREHFTVLGLEKKRFEVRSRWFSGEASISTYALDELLGTKLRALYQRKKGRDLFDLWWIAQHAPVDFDRVVHCFHEYLEHGEHRVSRAEFEANLVGKLDDARFTADLSPLLAPGVVWDLAKAARLVADEVMPRLSGEPWKGPGE